MHIKKIKAGGINIPDITRHVGEKGLLFYDQNNGLLRLGDGHTPGGLPVQTVFTATTATLGLVKIGNNLSISADGTLNAAAGGNANIGNFVFAASQMSVSNNSDITVVTNANTWTFGADGLLAFPNGGKFGNPYVDGAVNLSGNENLYAALASYDTKSWVGVVDATYGAANYAAPGGGFIVQTDLNGANNTWVFKADGATRFPSNTIKLDVGSDLSINTTGATGLINQTSVTVVSSGTNYLDNSTYVTDYPNTVITTLGGPSPLVNSGFVLQSTEIFTVGDVITIPAGIQGNTTATVEVTSTLPYSWSFANTGQLNLPRASNGNARIQSADDIDILSANSLWTFGTNGTLTAPGHLMPNADLAYDLGSTTTQWRSIYVGTGTIFIGGVALGVNADNFVTVDGNPIITVNTTGNFTVQGDTNIVLGAVVISDTAPAATTPGSQWYNSVEGRTYVAYNGAWVDASPTVVPAPETYLQDITIDGSTLNINGGTLTIDDTGTLLVNGSEVTGGGGSDSGWQLTSSTAVISLGSDGVLTLPNGASIGSDNSSSGIPMTTNRGTILFGNIPDNPITGSSHFHIMKDNSASVDLFFGDDYNYVKLPGAPDYGVEVGVQGSVWTFVPNGHLELPNGGTISAGMGAIRLEPANASSSTQALLIYPTVIDGNHIHLTAGGGETDLYLGNDSQYVKVDHSGTIVIGTLGANTSTWTFGTDGSTTFPNDTILGTGLDPNVYIETATTATTSTWTFGTDGILTLPAATPVIRGGGTGTDVTVIASTGSNTSTWVFGADGSTQFPSDTIKAPLGTYVQLSDNAGKNFVTVSDTDVTISAQDTTEYNWTFGTDGTLTFPDSTVQTTAWNDTSFMAAMLGYDGEIITNTATVGVGGLTVNGPVTFNGPFTFQSTATTQVTGNTGTFYGDVNGVGALYAGVAGYSPLPSTVFQSAANVNAYIQNNFQNLNNGVQASAEWVATANNGDDSNHYLDMGIAGSNWDGSQSNSVGTAASANDSWVYAQGSTSTSAGGNLILGTIKNGKSVKILTGSTGSGSIVATFNGRGVNATTTNTGALQVIGGIGASGSVYAGSIYSGDGYFRGPSGFGQLQLVSGGELYIPSNLVMSSGGLIKGPGGNTHIGLLTGTGGSVRFYNTATISGTAASVSTQTGALTVAGGVGIAGNTYVGGYVVQQSLPSFRVAGNGGAISSGTTLTSAHWTMDYNQGNYLNTSTGVFTVPVTGIYQINLVMRTNSNTNSTINQAIVIKNTSTSLCMLEFGVNTTMNHAGVSTAARLVAGDTVKVTVAVGTMSFDANDNWSIAFLG
jgi:hypothetical protein